MNHLSKRLLLAASAAIALAGCNAGDENPVSPQKMDEIRNSQSQDRGNFNPQSPPKPDTGTTATTG